MQDEAMVIIIVLVDQGGIAIIATVMQEEVTDFHPIEFRANVSRKRSFGK